VDEAQPLIVTIDGPGASGKSSVARLLARALRVPYVERPALPRRGLPGVAPRGRPRRRGGHRAPARAPPAEARARRRGEPRLRRRRRPHPPPAHRRGGRGG